jgi:hypothetical protein
MNGERIYDIVCGVVVVISIILVTAYLILK